MTPVATPTPVMTATATPTPPPPSSTPESCAAPLTDAEQSIVAQAPQVGCPLASAQATFMARQPFEAGVMIWRKDTTTIYVLGGDGHWHSYPDQWDETQAVSDPDLTQPTDLLQPVRGFGKVWREALDGAEAAIGWATAPEAGLDSSVQPWTDGLLLRLADAEIYALLDNGSWQPMEAHPE